MHYNPVAATGASTSLSFQSAVADGRISAKNATDLETVATSQRQVDRQRAEEVRSTYTDFVGKTFFAQLIKAMRTTQEKPAYFHGGRAEEVFQSQLDQSFVDAMSEASASRFAEPMFEHQFPRLAQILAGNAGEESSNRAEALAGLRRR